MNGTIIVPLLGGVFIGLSSALMMLLLGRITGISGILATSFSSFNDRNEDWRRFFIFGLFLGGIFLKQFFPSHFEFEISTSLSKIIIAGLLVGFGTRLGSGCTSGHGVCGLPRFSKRSFVATLTFMLSGVTTVLIMRFV